MWAQLSHDVISYALTYLRADELYRIHDLDETTLTIWHELRNTDYSKSIVALDPTLTSRDLALIVNSLYSERTELVRVLEHMGRVNVSATRRLPRLEIVAHHPRGYYFFEWYFNWPGILHLAQDTKPQSVQVTFSCFVYEEWMRMYYYLLELGQTHDSSMVFYRGGVSESERVSRCTYYFDAAIFELETRSCLRDANCDDLYAHWVGCQPSAQLIHEVVTYSRKSTRLHLPRVLRYITDVDNTRVVFDLE